jgi:periplasmic divalent cation tolerance protein
MNYPQTRKSFIQEVTQTIQQLHSYSVPEVIAIDLQGGNEDYFNWVTAETEKLSSRKNNPEL